MYFLPIFHSKLWKFSEHRHKWWEEKSVAWCIHSLNKHCLGSFSTVISLCRVQRTQQVNNPIFWSSHTVKESDRMNYNEEGTKVGGSTGQCGNPDDSWYEGQRNHKRLQEAVVRISWDSASNLKTAWPNTGCKNWEQGGSIRVRDLKTEARRQKQHSVMEKRGQQCGTAGSALFWECKWDLGRDDSAEENKTQIMEDTVGTMISRDSWDGKFGSYVGNEIWPRI